MAQEHASRYGRRNEVRQKVGESRTRAIDATVARANRAEMRVFAARKRPDWARTCNQHLANMFVTGRDSLCGLLSGWASRWGHLLGRVSAGGAICRGGQFGGTIC